MFRVGRVSAQQLAEIRRRAEALEPTYEQLGATLTGDMRPGYRHDRHEITLPDCPDAFERGAQGLREWVAHRGAGLTVEPADSPATGATVAVAAPTGPLTAVAVCRVVEVVEERDRYGFAY